MILGRDTTTAIRFQEGGTTFVSQTWYSQIVNSFARTPVGAAIQQENRITDWQLVSLRVAPCMPLGSRPSDEVDDQCWPEVRLVWQPFIAQGPNGQVFADDRAVHAIYNVPPSLGLPAPESARVQILKDKLSSYYAQNIRDSQFELNVVEAAEFQALRNKLIVSLLADVAALRPQQNPPAETAYQGVGLRPELNTSQAAAFRSRLLQFVTRYANAQNIKELTAFSLPRGRAPARINRWSFVSFSGRQGQLTPRDLLVTSVETGSTLFNFGLTETVSRQAEDPRLLNADLNPEVRAELENTVIFNNRDRNRLFTSLSDRDQILVPNTSCASCHKLNNNPNDFHNQSYFTGNPAVTISPRTANDVAWDLRWLKAQIATE